MPNEIAAKLVRVYGKPVSMVSLDMLGIGHLNRDISWKYVHSQLVQIVDVEGFSTIRYKQAIGVEPPDNDRFVSSKRTQAEANASGGMLPLMKPGERIGLLTKNHLLFVLFVLLDGRIVKDHDKSAVWTVPVNVGSETKHNELFEALQRGLLVVVLDKTIWENESPDDIRCIVDVDNLDQVHGMADHEFHVIKKISKLLVVEERRVDPTKTKLVERVVDKLNETKRALL